MAFPKMRRTKVGTFGTAQIVVSSGQIGGANYLGGAAPLTVNSTTTFSLPTPPFKCRFAGLAASVVTVPVDADGTILIRAMKYNAATTAQIQVGTDINAEALVTRQITKSGVLSTATDPQQIFNGTSDSLEVNIINNSAAIDTQPAGLVLTAYFFALE